MASISHFPTRPPAQSMAAFNSSNLTIWKARDAAVNEAVRTGEMVGRLKKAGYWRGLARGLVLVERLSFRQLPVLPENYSDGFPVLEHEMFREAGLPWLLYAAAAGQKTLLIGGWPYQNREEAARRAIRWMEICPRRDEHRGPIFVDRFGLRC